MEYEIEDDDALFDSSNNPSLDHSTRQAIENQSSVRPKDYPNKKRAIEKAELVSGENDT